jgi:hypothetical protein
LVTPLTACAPRSAAKTKEPPSSRKENQKNTLFIFPSSLPACPPDAVDFSPPNLMVSIVGARCFAPDFGHAQHALNLQGAQEKIIVGAIHESPLRVRRIGKVAA